MAARRLLMGWHFRAVFLAFQDETPERELEPRRAILAFNLYSQIPFGTIHIRNPKVIELAKLHPRSVGAASWKLANFARLDPALKARGIKGARRGAKGEEK